MTRAWRLAAVAIAVIGVGALVACEARSAKDALRSAASVTVASAFAQDEVHGGCSLVGTFATEPRTEVNEFAGTPPWISTSAGTEGSGTIVTDVFHWPNITLIDPDTGAPAFPSAVRISTMRGVWQRTGGNTLAFTQIGWVLDAKGDVVYVVRNSGRTTVTEKCNSEIVKSSLEFFAPKDFPDGGAFFTEQIDDMVAQRVTLSLPTTE